MKTLRSRNSKRGRILRFLPFFIIAIALVSVLQAAPNIFSLKKGYPTRAEASVCPSLKVLLVHSDKDTPPNTLKNQLTALPEVSQVDFFDGQSATPTLAQLQAYSTVVVFSDNPYKDSTALGNVLADYVDWGGIVVATNFNWHAPAFGIAGRWISGNYSPFLLGTGMYQTGSLGSYTSGHPLMQGVSTLQAFYRVFPVLDSGATQVASWSDAGPLLAYKGHVVGIAAYLGEYGGVSWSGDFAKIIVNTGKWFIPCSIVPTPSPTPTCAPMTPWAVVAPLPIDEYGAAVVGDGQYVYAGGGYSFSQRNLIPQFVRYDANASQWSPLSPMPVPVLMGLGVYTPGKIYVIGGQDLNTRAYTEVRVYDIAYNKWSVAATLPEARGFAAGGAINGKIFIAGGSSGTHTYDAKSQLWIFDPTTKGWTSKASMPMAVAGAASAIVNGHLYVIGGRDINGNILNTVFDYNISTNTWITRAVVPTAVNVPGYTVSGGKIYIYGGGTPFAPGQVLAPDSLPQGQPDTLLGTQIYDPTTNTWSVGSPQIHPRSFQGGGGVVGSTLVSSGGFGYYGTETTTETTQVNVCGGLSK